MQSFEEKFEPKRNKDLTMILSNVILIILTGLILVLAFDYYESRINTVTLNENRFLTTEWHLLQELKAQTDQKLLEKDKEIAELRRKYMELSQGGSNTSELQEIEEKLEQAQKERDQIASQRLEVPDDTEAEAERSSPLQEIDISKPSTPLAKVLQKKVETLEAQLKEKESEVEVLKNEINELKAEYEENLEEHRGLVEKKDNRIDQLVERINRSKEIAGKALSRLNEKVKENQSGAGPSVEVLNTRALLRALASQPEVRAAYPNLQESLERYFRVYGMQRRLEGRREAYSTASEVVTPVIQALTAQ